MSLVLIPYDLVSWHVSWEDFQPAKLPHLLQRQLAAGSGDNVRI